MFKLLDGGKLMLIQVDFFKESGKWYSGGRVEVAAPAYETNGGVISDIIDKQKILVKDWWKHKEFYVVTDDIPESKDDPNYRMTYKHLYTPQDIFNFAFNYH